MKISKGTIVRTIMMLLVIVNIVLQHMGYDIIDVDESAILTLVELLIEIAIMIVGFWKNNSYTEKAIKADEFLKKLRDSDEEIEDEGGEL
jgi:SPP1 family holin